MKKKARLLITWDPPLHLENIESIVLFKKKHGIDCNEVLESGELLFETKNILEDSYVDEFDDFGTFRYAAFAKNAYGYSPCATNYYTLAASALWFQYCEGNYVQLYDMQYSYQPAIQLWEEVGGNYALRSIPYASIDEYAKYFELNSDGDLVPTIFHNEIISDFELEGKEQYFFDCSSTRVTLDANAVNGTASGAGSYDYGEVVQINCFTAGPQYEFKKWTTNAGIIADQYSQSTTIEVTGSGYVTAIFELKKATIQLLGNNVTLEGDGTYEHGTNVIIKAIPDSGYKFVRWEGLNIADTLNAETTTLIDYIDGDRTITAITERETLTAGYSTSSAITSRSGDPIGTIYYATDTQKLYVYDGTTWIIYSS
jgi:hypothetical protein